MASQVEWVKQNVGTAGTDSDSIELGSAAPGYIRMQDSSMFEEGDLIEYTLTDGNNRERGIAMLLLSLTPPVLVRVTIKATLINGSYLEYPPAGMSFSSTAIVSCEAVAKVNAANTPYPLMQWIPIANTTTATLIGMAAPTTGGTPTARSLANTPGMPYAGDLPCIGYATAATAGQVAFWRTNQLYDMARHKVVMHFRPGGVVADARQFCGIICRNSNPTNLSPFIYDNAIGVGCNGNNGEAFFIANIGADHTSIPIDNNINFNISMTFRLTLEPIMYAKKLVVTLEVMRESGIINFRTSTIIDNLFPAYGFLGTNAAIQLWRTNNNEAVITGLDIGAISVQQVIE